MFRNQHRIRVFRQILIAAVWPMAATAFSNGPPINRTGAAIDGGLTCTACHRTFAPANSGAGRVSLAAVWYTPGVKQNLVVTVEDPGAQRWGFELTARLRSDETKPAGTFTPVDGMIRVVCDPDARAAPCNGDKEFATQLAASTQEGTKVKGTFTIEWTPPATDVGEIVFYFAGNAADGNHTSAIDRIYTNSLVIRPVCHLTAKPTVTAVVDAASFRPAIGSGALISIMGTGFSSSSGVFRAATSDLVGGKLDTTLGCVAVEIGGKRAPVFSLVGTQINAQAPQIDSSGAVNVQVILNPGTATELRSDVKTATAQALAPALAPALFLIDSKNVAARDASNSYKVVGLEVAAAPGDILVIYGTGFGATNPAWGTGEFPTVASPCTGTPAIMIGGVTLQPADVLYAGAAGDAPGFYQFNIRVPAGIPDGDAAVKITAGGFSTQDGAVLSVKKPS
jgi:uncharacterized protein (TIGR03437 family)